jgi:hypothetical protein
VGRQASSRQQALLGEAGGFSGAVGGFSGAAGG